MNKKGYVISFEGISGAGKSSVVSKFKEHLEKSSDREITIKSDLLMYKGENIGKDIKKILDKYRNNDQYFQFGEPGVETCLIMAKRAHEAQQRLLPKIKEGAIVLADRDIDTVCALQMIAWEKFEGSPSYKSLLTAIRLMNSYSLVVPSLTFYFDVSIETARLRVEQRDDSQVNARDMSVWERSKDYYEQSLNKYPLKGRKVVIVDTDRNGLEAVVNIVIKSYADWLGETKRRE